MAARRVDPETQKWVEDVLVQVRALGAGGKTGPAGRRGAATWRGAGGQVGEGCASAGWLRYGRR